MWPVATMGHGGAYSHILQPNLRSCVFNSWHGDSGVITASSWHSGGVNVGSLDGSVKFVKDSVNIQTWWAIATKAGGEVVSADSF
jgi:prepilin-type processing-associated H-X9-DG protein